MKPNHWELHKRYPVHRYRCSLFPWLKARSLHHTTYERYGKETLWVDVVPVSKFGHWFIHGLCGGSVWMVKAVTRQNRMAKSLPLPELWKYPNPAQRLTHAWCRVPPFGKLLAALALLWMVL